MPGRIGVLPLLYRARRAERVEHRGRCLPGLPHATLQLIEPPALRRYQQPKTALAVLPFGAHEIDLHRIAICR